MRFCLGEARCIHQYLERDVDFCVPGRLAAIKTFIDSLKNGSAFPSYGVIKRNVIGKFGADMFALYKEQIQVGIYTPRC